MAHLVVSGGPRNSTLGTCGDVENSTLGGCGPRKLHVRKLEVEETFL